LGVRRRRTGKIRERRKSRVHRKKSARKDLQYSGRKKTFPKPSHLIGKKRKGSLRGGRWRQKDNPSFCQSFNRWWGPRKKKENRNGKGGGRES